jgi:hypothetical protein
MYLELVRVKRFLHMPTGKLYIRQPENARSEDEVNAFEFPMSEVPTILSMKDPNGLPLFRPYVNRAARKAREQQASGAVRPVRFPTGRPDLSVEDLDPGASRSRAPQIIEDNDPELAARFSALDSPDEPSVTVG